MTWDRSREHRPDLGNCSDPSEKSEEAGQKRGSLCPGKPVTHGQAAPGYERAVLGVEDNACDGLADLEPVLVD